MAEHLLTIAQRGRRPNGRRPQRSTRSERPRTGYPGPQGAEQ